MKQADSFKKAFISLLYLSGLYSKSKKRKNYKSIFDKAKTLLEEEREYLDENLTITKLSRKAGTNRTYLSRAFSESGMNFIEYVNDLRVRNIKRVIDENVKSGKVFTCEELAIIGGFGSMRAMVRNFKKKEGNKT